MKIYLAAPYAAMDEMQKHAFRVRAAGHDVTARWIDGDEEGQGMPAAAQMDLDDIDAADVLIIFTFERGTKFTGGGRFVEMGYAIARGKRLVVVGGRENVFCHLPQVCIVNSIEEAVEALRGKGVHAISC